MTGMGIIGKIEGERLDRINDDSQTGRLVRVPPAEWRTRMNSKDDEEFLMKLYAHRR